MLVVCKYIVPSVTARVASEEECQGSSSPMSGAGRMLVTLTPRTVMPMAKDVLSTYLHIYRLGFSALDSPLPTLLMSHATGWLLVWSRMQMTLDRGVSSQCTVGQSPKGMMVFIYIGHYQGCRVLKCVQGCCRVCPGVLQNVCRDTECVQGAVLTSSLAQQD